MESASKRHAGAWLPAALALLAGLSAAGAASALNISSVVASGSGYESAYDFDLTSTINGNDVTNIVILEGGAGSEVSLDFPYTASPGGRVQLSHTIGFLPTSAMIVGLELAAPNVGDGKTHIVMLVDRGFAAGAIGLRFSEAFPNSRHSLFIEDLLLAVGGDATAQQALVDFFLTGDGAVAAFAPGGSYSRIMSTTIVPEPGAALLLAVGAASLCSRRRRAAARDLA